MQLPTPSLGQSHSATNKTELEILLQLSEIKTLSLSQNAAIEINLIIQLIQKNASSLVTLKIDGRLNEQVPKNQSLDLATAISQCSGLRILAIENFRAVFAEHVSYLTGCFENLPKLDTLSFDGTYLGGTARTIFLHLSKANSLKRLHLENCASMSQGNMSVFAESLKKNTSLEEIYLGKATLTGDPAFYLKKGLMHYTNNIKIFRWEITSFSESEAQYSDDREQTNWNNDPHIAKTIQQCRDELQNYHKTGNHSLLYGFERICLDVQEAKKFIAEKNNSLPKKSLVFTCEDDFRYTPYKMTASIYQQRASLQELVIYPRMTKDYMVHVDKQQFNDFVTVISSCTQLRSLKICGLKNSYTENDWSLLLTAIASLPKLRSLSLNESYIGDEGSKALILILERNVLVELDLSSAGHVSGFAHLSQALMLNTSLSRLELGDSPMMISWMNSLAKVMRHRHSIAPLKIFWQCPSRNEMTASITEMGSLLAERNRKTEYETQSKSFISLPSSTLMAHWATINAPLSSYSNITHAINNVSRAGKDVPPPIQPEFMLNTHELVDCDVKNKDDLFTLLTAKNIGSISIYNQATLEYQMIIKIIHNNKDTLREISLDGSWVQSDIEQHESEQLANAIKSCSLLEKLVIHNFYNTFKNYIEYFTKSLDSLKNINELSFQNTYLGRHANLLFEDLATHTQLKNINLSNTALVSPHNMDRFENALKKNTCLEQITLGRTPTRLTVVDAILNGITCSTSKVTVLNWNWSSWETSEHLYWTMDKLTNWENDQKINKEVDGLLQEIERCRGTQKHYTCADYRVAEIKFGQLMSYISERADWQSKRRLSLEIHNEHDFNLNLLAAQINLHSRSLLELTIRVDSIEGANPSFFPKGDFENFVQALKSCKKLMIFNFENMQGIFKKNRLTSILKALQELPNLQSLSLKKTYLGDVFIKELATLIKQDRIRTLDLTLSGLISLRCIIALADAISANNSLRWLILGKSPMTAQWLEALAKGIRNRNSNSQLSIKWIAPDVSVMPAQICAMITDLGYDNDTAKMVFDIFINQQNGDIQKQWTALQELLIPITGEKPVAVVDNSTASLRTINHSSYGTISSSNSFQLK